MIYHIYSHGSRFDIVLNIKTPIYDQAEWRNSSVCVVPHHATRRLCVIPKKRLTVHTLNTLHTSRNLGWGGGGGGGVGCNDMHCHAHN